jgi:cyclopropane-fatty-acyl-phospholipid synthase
VTVARRLADLVREGAGVELPVRIRAWDGTEAGPAEGPVLVINNRRALRRLLWAPGEMGLARAYVTGDIDVDGDMADGFRRAWAMSAKRRTSISLRDKAGASLAAARIGAVGLPPKPPASEARLAGRLHTRGRDRAAIAHHYDLSNDFYKLLLDEHMAYSSAYYTHDGQSLHDAQSAKLDLVCRKLELKEGQRLLDVGCGWGSMILYAARNFGDAVSSIEMGEHVGEGNYPTYVSTMLGALKSGSRLVLQQMSRREGTAPGGGPFIESYIAPDMHMRPLWQTVRYLENAGFEVRGVEAMREHYVKTVEQWLEAFETFYDEFVALQGEEVARVWRLYLVGGGLAFEQGRMGVDQILARKP